jgi:hypothetical protein
MALTRHSINVCSLTAGQNMNRINSEQETSISNWSSNVWQPMKVILNQNNYY